MRKCLVTFKIQQLQNECDIQGVILEQPYNHMAVGGLVWPKKKSTLYMLSFSLVDIARLSGQLPIIDGHGSTYAAWQTLPLCNTHQQSISGDEERSNDEQKKIAR